MRIPGLASLSPVDVAKGAVSDFFDDDMMTYAAAIAFRVLLALFPFVIFLLTLLGTLDLTEFFDWLLRRAETALPREGFTIISGVVNEIRNQPRGGLLSFSIFFAIWTASTAVRSVMTALNAAYDVEESRPAWKRMLLSIVYTIGLAVLLIAVTGLMVLGPDAVQRLVGTIGLSPPVIVVWNWLRWPVAALILMLAFAVIYKVAPNIDQPFRFVSPGSVIGVVAWIAATVGFSTYVAHFGNYGATYGSLGGIIIVLLYFFISAAVMLFGAEINATILSLQRRRSGTEPAQ